MKKVAKISPCERYRYTLGRIWDSELPYVAFIGLNPSTADAVEDDPTLNRCIQYAKAWGYGGVWMVNLFAFRATSPVDMKAADDPVGPDNDLSLKSVCEAADLVVAAWGNHGSFRNRSRQVRVMLDGLHCLKLNKSGEPAHPLYQRKTARPEVLPSS
ncbi:DUF1643 domain-containing protein [Halomonas marinisediminis]|uniref:DUF1643 domain-containing protein n=1 Tax=Halomonas marinisediminis TaxID=2546095 RepID=A0ABY2DAB8_9GAMM|nr:DUF1643 domain-containing protein [Halomonas marinisediminis]TDB05122.1 DUF1643 domain-containing protein [Halomonas marinisediminis]